MQSTNFPIIKQQTSVGSITPCINDTYMQLRDCPLREINFCIKYISEGTIVRDCVPRCTEKDNWDWNSRTFCCQEDGCNAAEGLWHWHIPILLFAMPFFHLMARSLH
ncbi:uncharacterized protein LOC115877216 [Sitophilus oryzae]|uniref:Uncharacterized protein LOC115877216 n=1 Tax=Sitophilus oryzae TaxID=7048 RepID=A0A6J2XD35_SITOR|nr:uncharacterized protein LOC115877216 [Sitophilus oryzae]